MAEEWPIGAASADETRAPARDARGGRLSTVRADFFLSPADRLTEQERALMTAMLHCLVSDIGDEVAAALPSGAMAANDEGQRDVVGALVASGLLNRGPLIGILLRRADEERIATAAKARIGRREARVVQGLVSHDDGAIAAAAMALIIARGRRRDRFGQCLLHFDDLPPSEAAVLVHIVSAAVRSSLADIHGNAQADAMLASAAQQVILRHDPSSGIEMLTSRLVQILDEEGGLTDELVGAAAGEGEIIFVGHAIARRAAIGADVALDELLSGHHSRAMALLRVAGVARDVAANLLAGVGDLLGIDDPGRAIGAFDAFDEAQVDEARSWLRSEGAYRAAVGALGSSDG